MSTILFTHPACLLHETPPGHPERSDRLRAILAVFEREDFAYLHREQAPEVTAEQIARVHPTVHVDALRAMVPEDTDDWTFIDADTALGAGSWAAALRASGAVVAAVDAVAAGTARNAFCAVRPPGHHAERTRAMGFCFLNSVAIGAYHARAVHGFQRVAVIDFDVHHGNGTQDIFYGDPEMFYASTHQFPLFPGTGHPNERGVDGNILNAILMPGSGSMEFRQAMDERVLPAVEAFKPDFMLISAGFDAHQRDPLANLNLTEADFVWATRALMDLADTCCGGRIVSTLEGGYDLRALQLCTVAHVQTLMGA